MSGPTFQIDPHRHYREMRRDHGPVVPVVLDGGVPAWLVIGYRELHQVTSEPELYSRISDGWNQWELIPDDWPLLPMVAHGKPSILNTVGDRHRERVTMINTALERVDPFLLKQDAEEVADALIDDFCTRGEAEIVSQYALLLPISVLSKLFGFSDEQVNEVVDTHKKVIDDAMESFLKAVRSVHELVARKAEEPGPDVASRMLENTSGFTDVEIINDLLVMMAAGHQPIADWISSSVRLTLTDERFAASLSGGRHYVAEAMNEVLWEDTPTQNVAGRWATRDTRLGNHDIRSGDLLILSYAGANFDPQVRTDSSTLTGGNSAFFSFGHGEHRCPFPAQEIAEVIARTGIEVLLDRLPDIDLAVSAEELVRRPSPWFCGLDRLPVRFTPTPVVGGTS
ncbi:cytochrome P450 [Streptomyces sp. NPDC088725]|uniref:cytochrome P450 n=1 Tax=Streptomyces sp. NPDC088725 TaxID=3365873 RepID=UPI0037F1A5BF